MQAIGVNFVSCLNEKKSNIFIYSSQQSKYVSLFILGRWQMKIKITFTSFVKSWNWWVKILVTASGWEIWRLYLAVATNGSSINFLRKIISYCPPFRTSWCLRWGWSPLLAFCQPEEWNISWGWLSQFFFIFVCFCMDFYVDFIIFLLVNHQSHLDSEMGGV